MLTFAEMIVKIEGVGGLGLGAWGSDGRRGGGHGGTKVQLPLPPKPPPLPMCSGYLE